MAKDKIADYDASAAGNTDIGGIGIQGTNAVSNFDGAFREIMSQLKEADNGTSPVTDTWSFCDPADRTKIFRIDAGSIPTATTRTYTAPNASGTLPLLGLAQTWTAVQTMPSGSGVSGSGNTTLIATSTANDPILELDASGGSWTMRNVQSSSNGLFYQWEGTTKFSLTTSGAVTVTGASPSLRLADDDTSSNCLINANNSDLAIAADTNNLVANTVITLHVDGSEKARFGGSSLMTLGGLSADIDPASGTTDGITFSSAYSMVRSTNGFAPFAQRRRGGDGAIQTFYRDTTLVGSISVTTTATAYNTSSDERLKQDFQPIDPAIIDAIQVYDFAWKADNSRSFGVKAQELLPILPQAVCKGEDAAGMLSVDYSKIVPVLIAALKDARARIIALENA